jgi:hypothetical protein
MYHNTSIALGPMAFDPVSGELYYVGHQWYHPKLNRVTWVDADNMLDCPFYAGLDESFQTNSFRRADTTQIYSDIDSVNKNNHHASLSNISLFVFPNPSEHVFTFSIKTTALNVAELIIEDIIGKEIFSATINLKEGSNEYSWNAAPANNGLYLYKIRAKNERVVTGKLLKM